jgi:Polyketide cyclase / dehydrase and lipid transport
MAALGLPAASADITIKASAERVYSVITDLPTLAELADETTAMAWRRGDSAQPGSVFKGTNRNGSRSWTTTCTVTDADPGRVFAFDVKSMVIPVAHWRYEITPTAEGCTVTESTWDRRPGWFKGVAGLATGVRDRVSANTEHIRATLQRLKAHVEGR